MSGHKVMDAVGRVGDESDRLGAAEAASISVIIPSYNSSRTLRKTIASALAQADADIDLEVMVVDDGATDDSLSIARTFEPSIRVLTGPNRGVSAARNLGIEQTKGEWIVFLDSDDSLLPGTLSARRDEARKSGADVIVCDWQIVELGESASNGPARSVDMAALTIDPEIACATHFWGPPAALMYRRALVEKIGGFRDDLPVIQDARFIFDAAYHGARFAHSPHVGASYRVQPQSLSRRDPGRFSRDLLTNGTQIEALWRARGDLSHRQHDVLAGMYGLAARGLFAGGCPEYFEAIEAQRRHGGRLTLHPRIAAPLARVFGLHRARLIFRLLGR